MNKKKEFDNTDNLSDVIGKKNKELWYPTYVPHIDIKTGKSILDEIYREYPNLKIYR